MANQIIIDIGATANDGTGDPLRTAFDYVNDNFSNVWNTGLPSSNVLFSGNRILTANTNGNLILSPNGIGKVVANVDIRPNANNTLSLGSSDLRWNSVYAQNLDVGGNVSFNNVTVGGNLTVQGNIIQVGNIVTETLTIQLANAAVTANSANGSGITVGANDNIATLLYNSSSNVWTTNIGITASGNVAGTYFIGNGSQLTGITSYSNTNATSLLAAFGSNTISTTGNITAGYFLGNGSQLTGVAATGNLEITGTTISIAAGAPETYIDLSASVQGWAYVQVPNDATANVGNVRIHNDVGNIEFGTDSGNNLWYFGSDGNLIIPGEIQGIEGITGNVANIRGGFGTAGPGGDVYVVGGASGNGSSEFGNVIVGAGVGAWTFDNTGNLNIPGIISSSSTIEIDNRATSNTADIRLYSADDIFLQGRDKPDDLEAEGGDIFVYGGDGANAATSGFDTGGGGDVQIEGGLGGTGQATGTSGGGGGIITIAGGDGGSSLDSTAGGGGSVNISAGTAADPISGDPAQGGLGGGVNISAGDTTRINENGGSIEITTGSPTSTGTGAAGYVAINIASSNVGPGGNWTFTGTGTTLNVPANAEIFGANAGNLTVGCAGNTIVTSSDYGANVKNWVFGYTGNLTLPQGGVVYETNIPFGGLEGKTIALKPYGGTDADQQLLVYPTAGTDFNHLHLTTGNLWNTEMFLGNDDFYVKLANTGNVVINSNDSIGNTAQWTFDYNSTISTNNDLTLQVSDGIPTSTANINSQGGYNIGSYTGLSTTGGSGTGLTVNASTAGNGYIDTVTINAPGSGYTNGDTITIVGGDGLGCTFTIGVPTPAWTFGTDSSLTLPTISLGTDLDEQTVVQSQRKLIPPFRWSAVIDGTTPTVVYTATNAQITSMKVTIQIQHSGVGMEFFEVFASESANDTYYTVSNRVAPPALDASTVVVGLNGSNEMQITVTVNSGAGTSWVTYDAVEFGIPND